MVEKHTALNTGVKQIKTELTMIVDSDDCLLPDAIEIISGIYSKYKDNMKIGSFTFLKIKSDGKAVVSLEENELVANYDQVSDKKKIDQEIWQKCFGQMF